MNAGLAAIALAACACVASAQGVEPAGHAECVQLLGGDEGQPSLRDALIRNLAAPSLAAAKAAHVRRTSELTLAALSGAGAPDIERLCAVIVPERVRQPGLLTGYYRPVVPARRSRDDEFRHPLHALPPQNLRTLSRAEIDAGGLDGKVPVVAWLADPVEAFFVHIQGSAVLALPDGHMTVGFAGSNGRPYTSIGALLIDEGLMRREDVTMPSLKDYLRDHASDRDRILRANERYIYFQQVPNEATGSMGVPLTDGRSVAADPDVYPPGTLLFVRTADSTVGVTSRLVVVQDRGSAIVGEGRLDLYLGTGPEAGAVAGGLRQPVEIFVLRAK